MRVATTCDVMEVCSMFALMSANHRCHCFSHCKIVWTADVVHCYCSVNWSN